MGLISSVTSLASKAVSTISSAVKTIITPKPAGASVTSVTTTTPKTTTTSSILNSPVAKVLPVTIAGGAIGALTAKAASSPTPAGSSITQSIGPVKISSSSSKSSSTSSGGSSKMADSTYDKIDQLVGGLLPGGTSPTPAATSTALKAAGLTAGAALAYGAYTAADAAFFGGKLPLGSQLKTKKTYRRIDYGNVKALKRSERRMTGFIKTYKKHAGILGYHVKRG